MKSKVLVLTALVASLTSLGALACGDSLYRVGKSVSYRVYTAPLPGNVLVYGKGEGAEQLAEALAQSGHGVRLVDNQRELDSEIQNGDYDVVIAAYSDHEVIEADTAGSAGKHPTYLPVAESRDEAAQAQQHYKSVMVADRDEIKNYLKAIHKALKKKT